jgi:transcriptional regulator with GAF, ATPase, and Fis domain
LVGDTPAMLNLFRSIQRVSTLSALPVLISGETGTGKELVAHAIYCQDAKRRKFAFVPLNCAALNHELSESELFGHRRGAFTGANYDRPGLFRSADRGVLFLDEIGELNAALQAKLLRVVQTNRVLAVGEDREIAVDVRVIAATNRNLPEMVKGGLFREDLYYRLNVTPLHIPPLRERRADIAPLVEHFLRKHQHLAQNGNGKAHAAPDFLHALERTALPGNARQVENLVRRALVDRETSGALRLSDLPEDVWADLSEQEESSQNLERKPPQAETGLMTYAMECLVQNQWSLGKSLAQLEELLVKAALEAAHGNQTEAARRLGITARSVYNKLHKRDAG